MAALDFSIVPSNILIGWMRSLIIPSQDDVDGFLIISKMTDVGKEASLKTYLTARVAANAAQSTFLDDMNTTAQNTLSSDTTECNSLLSIINS